MENAKPLAPAVGCFQQGRETPVTRQGTVLCQLPISSEECVVSPDSKSIVLDEHLDARRRAITIVNAMRSARRIEHPAYRDIVAPDPNGEVPHQIHRIQGGGTLAVSGWGRGPNRRGRYISAGRIDQAERAPRTQRIRNVGSRHVRRQTAVHYAPFNQIIYGAAGLERFPEPPPGVQGHDSLISGDHDQLIFHRQSYAV